MYAMIWRPHWYAGARIRFGKSAEPVVDSIKGLRIRAQFCDEPFDYLSYPEREARPTPARNEDRELVDG